MRKISQKALGVGAVLLNLTFMPCAYALPFFEYELLMQAQTSLDMGSIAVQGQIVNTGTIALNLTPQTISFVGLPSNLGLTTCDHACVQLQLSGSVLAPGNSFSFLWLSGTQAENLSGFAGSLLSASIGLVPLGSDWTWTAAGNIPEILVSSEWVNGAADTSLPFNKRIINLATAGEFMNTPTPLTQVPEPFSLLYLGFGLATLMALSRTRFSRSHKPTVRPFSNA